MNKMATPTGQHGKYLFWLQLLNHLSDFHTVFTDDLRKRSSLCPDQGDWCHSSPKGGLSSDLESLHFPMFSAKRCKCTIGKTDGHGKSRNGHEKVMEKYFVKSVETLIHRIFVVSLGIGDFHLFASSHTIQVHFSLKSWR